MPTHVIVDGSNLATEGRAVPSLSQLNDAVLAYIDEHPSTLVTVVVDATFGHRIDSKEVADFDDAVANNEIVAPPAGAIGRGDAFVLSIANKVNGTIISNDSFQEFHGQYTWLFDEGRLVGGKPVPHVGWVFVDRLPVRGPTSRKAVQQSRRKSEDATSGRAAGRAGGKSADATARQPRSTKASVAASGPPPVPKAPPPGARLSRVAKTTVDTPSVDQVVHQSARGTAAGANDLLPFLTFVEHHPPGTSVNAIVESYSSHGAYVSIGDMKGYVPLRLMADPAPRSAREFMKVGESVTLVVESFGASRRSVDLGLPTMVAVQAPAVASPKRVKPTPAKPTPAKPTPAKPALVKPTGVRTTPVKKVPEAKVSAKAPAAKKAVAEKAPAKRAASVAKNPAVKTPAARTPAATRVPAKPAPANPAAAAKPVQAKPVAAKRAAGPTKAPAKTTSAPKKSAKATKPRSTPT